MNSTRSFLDFEGRWVVVTGASSGLGRAVAIELARHGARVVLIGRDRTRLDETAAQLGNAEHRVLPLDLQQTAGITPAILALRDEVGNLYGLCHAAGIVQTRPLAATSPEIVRSQFEINVVAGLEIARAVARRDVTTPEGGSLLFIASVYGHVGMAGQSGYSATKGAVTAAVRSLAVELARRKVRVNSLSPGLVHTAMTQQSLGALAAEHTQKLEALHPLGPGQPIDVARAAVFMLAPGSGWITGADLAVDGGYTAQ